MVAFADSVSGHEPGGSEAAVATKAAKGERRARDHHGRVISKPHGLVVRAEPEPEGPRRTPSGKRIAKPFDPRNRGR